LKKLLPLIALFFFTISAALPVFAQTSGEDLKALIKDMKSLKEGQATIQKDIQEIKNLLNTKQAPPKPQDIALSVDGAYFKGDKNAKLTLIEFTDIQWPFCGKYVRETFPQIEQEYIKTGKVKYVFRDFPLDFHKDAFKAAEALHCAGEQDRFWEMHSLVFKNQTAIAQSDLAKHAQTLGLDLSKFQQCLDKGKYAAQIRSNIEDGKKAGVTGTPTFLLGVTVPNDPRVKVLKILVGAKPYASFKEAIDSLLTPETKWIIRQDRLPDAAILFLYVSLRVAEWRTVWIRLYNRRH
jgi:protein-disulfide isomerase